MSSAHFEQLMQVGWLVEIWYFQMVSTFTPLKSSLEPENTTLESTNNQFLGSMLVFGGVVQETLEQNNYRTLSTNLTSWMSVPSD